MTPYAHRHSAEKWADRPRPPYLFTNIERLTSNIEVKTNPRCILLFSSLVSSHPTTHPPGYS